MVAPRTLGRGYPGIGFLDSATINSVVASFNGATIAIAAAAKFYTTVPFDCTVVGWEMFCDISATLTVDVWAVPIASAPPTVTNTICGSTLPTITAATQASDFTLTKTTGWKTYLIPGDSAVIINVTSNNNATILAFNLIVQTGA